MRRKHKEETKEKIRLAHIGKPQTEKHKANKALSGGNFLKGNVPWNKGKTGLQQSKRKGTVSIETRGEKNPNWKGGASTKQHIIRTSNQYRSWKEQVLNRDGSVCKKCEAITTTVHHLYSFRDYPELRFEVDNGVTICTTCHRKFHNHHGWTHNTPAQMTVFLNNQPTMLTGLINLQYQGACGYLEGD